MTPPGYVKRPIRGLLSRFVEHYVDTVEHDIFMASNWSPTLRGKRAEQFCRDGWVDFEDVLRARVAAGEPPPDEWIARFPPKDGEIYTADGYLIHAMTSRLTTDKPADEGDEGDEGDDPADVEPTTSS